ncbi:MAG: hypothetical protein U9O94_00895 [Nanoarchaeota archaeon]|nr:hypothetical protein [Nanoarchaeota archaeon]
MGYVHCYANSSDDQGTDDLADSFETVHKYKIKYDVVNAGANDSYVHFFTELWFYEGGWNTYLGVFNQYDNHFQVQMKNQSGSTLYWDGDKWNATAVAIGTYSFNKTYWAIFEKDHGEWRLVVTDEFENAVIVTDWTNESVFYNNPTQIYFRQRIDSTAETYIYEYEKTYQGPKTVESNTVDTTSLDITSIYFEAEQELNDQNISLSVASDGTNFADITNEGEYLFTDIGSNLTWKATLSATDTNYTPKLQNLNLKYHVGVYDLYLDVGDDNSNEWSHDGIFESMDSATGLESAINSYLNSHIDSDDGESDGYISVPLAILSNASGTLNISNLNIVLGQKQAPTINSISATNPQGFGENVTITANITVTNGSENIDTVLVGITPPNEQETNYTMWNISSDIWTLDNFNDYTKGTYSYTLYVNGTSGALSSSSGTFEINVGLYVSVKTLKESYFDNDLVNITNALDTPFTLTQFNDSKNEDNITFIGNQNVTRYLELPSYASVVSASINLAGHNDIPLCYQEKVNQSTSCGGLSTGAYATSLYLGEYMPWGNWDPPEDSSGYDLAVDGTWNTGSYATYTDLDIYLFINYTKPSDAMEAIWQIGTVDNFNAEWYSEQNNTIPDTCFDYYQDKLVLRINVYRDSYGKWQCYNGSWETLHNKTTDIRYAVAEDAIWWNLSNYPTDLSIDVGDDGILDYQYSSTFDTSTSIELNVTAINNWLSENCESGNCPIPITFHSDTTGRLEYSNIDIVYTQSNESKIFNYKPTNTSVYLLMKVQYWSGSDWLDEATIQNDTTSRKILANETLQLDSVWNSNGWDGSTNTYGSGTYRVYTAVTDENDNILINYDGTDIVATYNFSYVPTKLEVYNFSMTNLTSTYKIFEFMIKNVVDNENLTGINWSLNTGLETINSTYTFNLTPGDFSYVFVEYNYTQTGDFTPTASATDGTNQDSETLPTMDIPDIEASNLTLLYNDSTYRIFSFTITNMLTTQLTSVNWTFDTDDSNVISVNQLFSLNESKESFIFVEYNYSSAGTYNVNATAINGSLIDSTTYEFTIT